MSHIRSWVGIPLSLLAVGVTVFSVMADISLELKFQDMDPHLGQPFSLRVSNTSTEEEITRLSVDEIPAATFELEISGLVLGESYQVDLFVDVNGNGRYDAPPVDHAWRIDLPNIQSAGSLSFVHNTMFTDIGWPPAIDGVIGEGEYAHKLVDPETGMIVCWANSTSTLTIGLVSPGTGWLSIGFAPERQMQGANILIAGIDGEVVTIEDHYGNSPTSHKKDDVTHIVQVSGSETDEGSVLEFRIPLDSGDDQDNPLVAGSEVIIILAYHDSNDSLIMRHNKRSTSALVLDN
jgi:DOMON domain-containing protein